MQDSLHQLLICLLDTRLGRIVNLKDSMFKKFQLAFLH